jgi:DNA-binding transcriptional MerR regulator
MSPSVRFGRVKALVQRSIPPQARDEYRIYAEDHLRTPPDFEQRVAHLANLGFPPDACAETLRMVAFDIQAAIELLTSEEARVQVERAHGVDRRADASAARDCGGA